jgi:hypothetical protein
MSATAATGQIEQHTLQVPCGVRSDEMTEEAAYAEIEAYVKYIP